MFWYEVMSYFCEANEGNNWCRSESKFIWRRVSHYRFQESLWLWKGYPFAHEALIIQLTNNLIMFYFTNIIEVGIASLQLTLEAYSLSSCLLSLAHSLSKCWIAFAAQCLAWSLNSVIQSILPPFFLFFFLNMVIEKEQQFTTFLLIIARHRQ